MTHHGQDGLQGHGRSRQEAPASTRPDSRATRQRERRRGP